MNRNASPKAVGSPWKLQEHRYLSYVIVCMVPASAETLFEGRTRARSNLIWGSLFQGSFVQSGCWMKHFSVFMLALSRSVGIPQTAASLCCTGIEFIHFHCTQYSTRQYPDTPLLHAPRPSPDCPTPPTAQPPLLADSAASRRCRLWRLQKSRRGSVLSTVNQQQPTHSSNNNCCCCSLLHSIMTACSRLSSRKASL